MVRPDNGLLLMIFKTKLVVEVVLLAHVTVPLRIVYRIFKLETPAGHVLPRAGGARVGVVGPHPARVRTVDARPRYNGNAQQGSDK